MSMVETYVLAAKAKAKLTKEAARQDHDLRKLVHHANLLDDLTERIQEHKYKIDKFNGSHFVGSGNTTVTFAVDYSDSDSDSDEESDDEVYHSYIPSEISYTHDDDEIDEDYGVNSSDEDEDEDSEEDEEEDEQDIVWEAITLTKAHSKSHFRSLPTIDELSEQEFDEIVSEESEEELESEQEFDIPEEETDITDLNSAPSLNYSSSTEDEDEDEDYHKDLSSVMHSNNQILNALKHKESTINSVIESNELNQTEQERALISA